MLPRLILSSFSRLLAGASLALIAIALAGCDDKVAEKPTPGRPVLVVTVHYEAESPERSFVGTIRPRIEADMGFRVPGKVAKRLVEVGETVDIGQPLATLDEIDLKLQAEQAEAEFRAATGVLATPAHGDHEHHDRALTGALLFSGAALYGALGAAFRSTRSSSERMLELYREEPKLKFGLNVGPGSFGLGMSLSF